MADNPNPSTHHVDCAWQLDQYEADCTCDWRSDPLEQTPVVRGAWPPTRPIVGLRLRHDTFQVGDKAHIFVGQRHGGKTTEGTVVAVLNLPGWGMPNYVVRVETPVDLMLEVRSAGLGMTKVPIGHDVEEDDDGC